MEAPIHRFNSLPKDHRGYPVPWFVAWLDGKPDFRVADQRKWFLAINEKLCWVCGQIMGSYKSFVIGPMCGINRVTTEPPCHTECAQWSARNCPFLANPNMIRNEKNLVGKNPGGEMIKRNPGMCLVWTTKSYKPFKVHNGYMIQVGEPTAIEFYTEGRLATRPEINYFLNLGCPAIENVARAEGADALAQFYVEKNKFLNLIEKFGG